MIKKLLFVLIFIMAFSIPASAKTKKKYLALGDSITYGYGLDNREEEAYANLFSKKHNLELTNEAVTGDRSTDLLERLANYNIDDYDVISICIGANDVFKIIVNDVYEKSVTEIIDYILNLDNNVEFNEKVEKNLKTLDENLGIIMNKLKSGQAQIYMFNVYNPFNKFFAEKVKDLTDMYVKRINEVIDKHKDGTHFIDLYSKFNKSKEDLVNSESTRKDYRMDPHPTPEGHKYIYNLLSDEYELHNIDSPFLLLVIIFGILVFLLEIIEILYTIKKFNVKIPKNIDIEPKLEDVKEEENKSSRFIRS